jgi:hypothetical protein
MITTRIINDAQEIAALLPHCKTLARNAGGNLPFHQIEVPLLWWKHFNSLNGADFAGKRGRNFLGLQSWVEAFHLVVAEKESEICGLAPLVSTAVKISAHDPNVRILSFAGDSVLIAYQSVTSQICAKKAKTFDYEAVACAKVGITYSSRSFNAMTATWRPDWLK